MGRGIHRFAPVQEVVAEPINASAVNGGGLEMARYNAMNMDFEEVSIFEKPALFTPLRIDRSTVPDGFYLYEVRHDDDGLGDAVQIAQCIVVNHWGSIITHDEIPPL